jgi:1,4-dihydroxy-2-naphthoate octaprenyltransferase
MVRGWPMIAIALPSFYLAYGYTGGPWPLAYKGLGELFVILFFGIVAVMGTVFVQTGQWMVEAAVAGGAIGCLSALLISINNLRDVDEDRGNLKNTLAVQWGRAKALRLLFLMSVVPYASLYYLFGLTWGLLAFLPAAVLGGFLMKWVKSTPPGPQYNQFLALAAVQLILYATAFTVCCL